jgi:hypothetical protein
MQDRKLIRQLYYLANRLESNAAIIRDARLPSHLAPAKRRMLRHLTELNHICDRWADTFKPTRRRKQPRPFITPYDKLSHWDSSFRTK